MDLTDAPSAEVNAFGTQQFGAWQASLTPAEAAAILSYQDMGYERINEALRGAGPPAGGPLADRVAQLDSALNRSPVPVDLVAYRGVRDVARTLGTDDPARLVGAEVTDRGFLSTSLKRSAAANVAADHPGRAAMIRLRVPAGTRGGYLDTIPGSARQAAHPHDMGERELLLARNTRYRITAATRSASGQLHLEAEVVGQ